MHFLPGREGKGGGREERMERGTYAFREVIHIRSSLIGCSTQTAWLGCS